MKKLMIFSLIFSCLLFIVSPGTQALAAKKAEKAEIPVLLYHVVSPTPDPDNLYQFSLEEFEKQMAYLKDNGYRTLTIKQYFNILYGNAAMPAKPILLTFDDNSYDFYPNVYPVLDKYDMKATQFTVSDWVNGSWNMTADEITTVMDNGIDIQNHSVTHPFLTQLSYEAQYAEISGATTALKSLTGKTTNVFAYPYGAYNADTIAVLDELGFEGAFTVAGGLSTSESERYEIPRIMILNGDTLDDFVRKIETGY
ncbi:polysaccharide deacetylase family protein [Planococcus lenghuensis]|uniref:NodB homology domain-containing protein n=1 Tax=Planococcus lenghuensis TaxID=2213202 RepID=A0A1Q2L2M2_9BACL|nr:polysaccharide deacetylase family protein [Planococcus lenghuensis]AQQ54708.1 hypothetical protein B0X71_17430 [Planococcus lenghuensis]